MTWTPIHRVAAIVVALLIVATAIVQVLKLWKPGRSWKELSARVNAWWIMVVVFFGVLLASPVVALVFFGLISFWALREYLTLVKTRKADRGVLFLAFLAIPVQYFWIGIDWYGMFAIFVSVYVFLAVPLFLVLARETAGFVASASQIQWGLMAFVFGLSHMAYTLKLPAEVPNVDGRTMLIFLVFVVEISDVLQYVWGKTLGRHKILPEVSPNKTWEGLIGGVATTAALSLALRFLTPFTMAETVGITVLLTVAGFFGGAVMSAVKRDFGVKDFGALIPGHGGILDRVDSLCYAAPIFFHYVRYFHGF